MATPVEIADVLVYAPELSTLPSPFMQVYLDLAKNFVFETKWERKYKQAVCLLTAHMVSMTKTGGNNSGPIASESVGELSISYSNATMDDELQRTSYGELYLMLRKTLKITPLVV